MVPHVVTLRTSSRSRSRSSSYDPHSRSRYGQGLGNHPLIPFLKVLYFMGKHVFDFLKQFLFVDPFCSSVKSDS